MRELDRAKVGDDLIGDPQFILLPRGVRLLLVELTTWSAARHTDGRVPRHVLGRLTDEPDATAALDLLVDAGFLERDGDDVLVDWSRQLNRENAEAYDAKNRANAARSRKHNAGDHTDCTNCWAIRKQQASGGDVHGVRTPERTRERSHTRPVTSRPVPALKSGVTGDGTSGGSRPEAGAPGPNGGGDPLYGAEESETHFRCARCRHVFARGHQAPDLYLEGAVRPGLEGATFHTRCFLFIKHRDRMAVMGDGPVFCVAFKKDGTPCSTKVGSDEGWGPRLFCMFHDAPSKRGADPDGQDQLVAPDADEDDEEDEE